MCGIIGVAGTASARDRTWLAAGRDTMFHRGPDDSGEWWSAEGHVGLAHRRLAIIELSPAGHQPMADASGELHIVFNGEIYNFGDLRKELREKGQHFLTGSDTEVILLAYRQWGVDCLLRFNGMFSFALYDARRQELFMARDRAGEKPLFYAVTPGAVRFASELKALLVDSTLSRRIDAEALDCYLTMGFVPGDRCILQGFKKLPPGHAMIFNLASSHARIWRYWDLPALREPSSSSASDADLVSELEFLLQDSVRRQLVADVPVGILLSGGVDSSLVTAMAARSARNVKTFTMRFPGHVKYDETVHARIVAEHFGTEHVELEADSSEESVKLLAMLARQFDEPVGDSSMVPTYLVSRLTREHCTVALGGDGGDELFGGYLHYSRLLRMRQRLGRVPLAVRSAVARAAECLIPVGVRGRNWLQGLGVDLMGGAPWVATHFDRTTRRLLMRHDRNWPLVGERVACQRYPQGTDPLQRATRGDFGNYLVEDVLTKVDRASMLNSLEVRAPLLDYRLIEFAFRKVPSHLKATATDHKILLKRLVQRVLPPSFDLSRKQGFSIPLASWLRSGPWWAFFREVLLGSNEPLFDRATLSSLLNGQARGRANSERLFALVMFELWLREYKVSL